MSHNSCKIFKLTEFTAIGTAIQKPLKLHVLFVFMLLFFLLAAPLLLLVLWFMAHAFSSCLVAVFWKCFPQAGIESGNIAFNTLSSPVLTSRFIKGRVMDYDFRLKFPQNFPSPGVEFRSPAPPSNGPLRMLTWNIHYGCELSRVITALANLDPDVIFLQEDNIVNHTQGDAGEVAGEYHHAAAQIAKALQMKCCSVIPFTRSSGGGFGVAILSKYDLQGGHVIESRIAPAIYKYVLPAKWMFVGAVLHWPSSSKSSETTPVHVYSVHCPAMGSIQERMQVFRDLVTDARIWRLNSEWPKGPTVYAGDFNTLVGSWSVVSPFHGTLAEKWSSLRKGPEVAKWANEFLPSFGMFDPFNNPLVSKPPANHTFSIGHGALRYSAKLDWVVLEEGKWQVVRCEQEQVVVGEERNAPSDHKWLQVHLSLLPEQQFYRDQLLEQKWEAQKSRGTYVKYE